MSNDRHQEMLQKYIERIVALQDERGRAIELGDMKNVAREIGMSDEDIAAADSAAVAHLERGLRFLEYNRWDDAIAELSDAAALNPSNIQTLHALASAHRGRWVSSGREEDRTEARRFARRSLELEPGHDPSYQILNELDAQGAPQKAPAPPAKRRGYTLWVVAGCLLLFLYIRGASFLAGGDDPPPPPPEQQQSQAPEAGDGTGFGSAMSVGVPDGFPNGTGMAIDYAEPVTPEFMPNSVRDVASNRAIPLLWECEKKEGIQVELFNWGSQGETAVDLMVANSGSTNVADLVLRVQGIDAEGRELPGADVTTQLHDQHPEYGGGMRVYRVHFPQPVKASRFKATVLAVG